jgi:hypothetical protein
VQSRLFRLVHIGGGKSPFAFRLQISVAVQQQAADFDVAKHSGAMQRSTLTAKEKQSACRNIGGGGGGRARFVSLGRCLSIGHEVVKHQRAVAVFNCVQNIGLAGDEGGSSGLQAGNY